MTKMFRMAIVVLLVGAAVVGWAWYEQHRPDAMAKEAARSAVHGVPLQADAYYENMFSKRGLVFDIQSARGVSRADIARALLQFADYAQNIPVERVVLAYRGEYRFQLSGEDFRRFGRGYGSEDIVVQMRTLPEAVMTMQGAPAFPSYTGGVLAVQTKQLENATAFADQWTTTGP